MADDSLSPPFYDISNNDHGAWVFITAVVFLVYSLVGVAAKVVSRWHFSALRKSYDIALLIGFALAIVQTIFVVKECRSGLGRHQSTLSGSDLESMTKYLYSASILSILVYTAGKLSVLLFIATITPQKTLTYICWGLQATVTVWGICCVFLIAFRCQLPKPWFGSADKCIDLHDLHIGINVANILTDIPLVILPAIMMWSVQTNLERRLGVIGLFATRIMVPILLVSQTVYWGRTQQRDLSWDLVKPTIFGQIAMNVSILTACVPSLKGVLEMFFSGASRFQVPAGYESYSGKGYGLKSLGTGRFGLFKSDPGARSHGSTTGRSKDYNDNSTYAADISRPRKKDKLREITERSESQVSLQPGVIMRTVEYEVEIQPKDDSHLQRNGLPSDGQS